MAGRDDAIGRNGETKDQLNARVRIWKWVLLGVAACLVGGYIIYFGLILEQKLAADADKWGQFGDFVGGLLNPIVAFAAFFWLTESVKLQKQELADTRAELKAAAVAQQQQVENGRATIQIAALTALAQDARNEYDQARALVESISLNRPPESERVAQMLFDQDHERTLALLNARIQQAGVDQKSYLSDLKQLLLKQRESSPA